MQSQQEERAHKRQQQALQIGKLYRELKACQAKLLQAEMSAEEESLRHADELAKTTSQLQVALVYRRKCRSQQAELKVLQQKVAGLPAKERHACDHERHAEKQPASQQSLKNSQLTPASLQRPAQATHVPAQPDCNQQIMAGAGVESHLTHSQDDVVLNSQVTELLQKLQDAEKRVQEEAQRRHAERKNVREVLRKRDEELKALKATSEGFRRQLLQLGALQEPSMTEPRPCRVSNQRSGSNGACV